MSTGTPKTHSFVLKIWTEDALDPSQDAVWRGSITHAESGKRQYIESLPEMVTVVAPYLVMMGAPLDWTTRLITWWSVPHAPSDDSSATSSPTTPPSIDPTTDSSPSSE